MIIQLLICNDFMTELSNNSGDGHTGGLNTSSLQHSWQSRNET